MMPKAVAKAAMELNEANIMVEVLIDLDVANLRDSAMACVASLVVFEEVVARWYVVNPSSPPTAAYEASNPASVLAMVSLSSTSVVSRCRTSKRYVMIAMHSSARMNDV